MRAVKNGKGRGNPFEARRVHADQVVARLAGCSRNTYVTESVLEPTPVAICPH